MEDYAILSTPLTGFVTFSWHMVLTWLSTSFLPDPASFFANTIV